MQALARREQESVVLSFERDYGKLVMLYNRGGERRSFKQRATQLANQIKKAATPNYFEDDIIEFLEGLSTSISQTIES